MDAIMLAMKKRGIRFFSKVIFNHTDVKRFYSKVDFIPYMRSRRMNYDNVLLMAHGSSNAILTTTRNPNKPYNIYISETETHIFQNDFVFAISCLTALEFGQKCIDNGAITYLGYQVEIGPLFSSYSTSITNLPKRVSTALDTIIKHIFVQSLSVAFQEFLCNPISVSALKERFSYLVEREISELLTLNAGQIYTKYNIKICEQDYNNYIVALVLRVLSHLNEISSRLVCLGEENYISHSFIDYYLKEGQTPDEILECITHNEYYKKMNSTYQNIITKRISGGENNV